MEVAVWRDKIWMSIGKPICDQSGNVRLGKLRISRNLQEIRIGVVWIEVVGYQIRSINCGKRYHYCRKFRSINSFILRNWGACVDTVFGHVSLDAYLELMASLQKSCR